MLKQQIQDNMKAALKGGDKRRLGAIRLLMAAIKQQEVDERIELDDTTILLILDKMVKQRRDSISHYKQAGRDDLVEQETFEIEILREYMPEALSEEAITTMVEEAIASSGAASIRDMGKVMAQIKPKVQGRADMSAVSTLVKQKLGT